MKFLFFIAACSISIFSFSQAKPKAELNWYLKDPKNDKVYGVGAEKAYKLLEGKKSKSMFQQE